MQLFLFLVLSLTTLLLCYAGYQILVVDRREEREMVEDSDLFQAIDDKNYDFELPVEVDEYDEKKRELDMGEEPADKYVSPSLCARFSDTPCIVRASTAHGWPHRFSVVASAAPVAASWLCLCLRKALHHPKHTPAGRTWRSARFNG